ncbi:acetyltransferase [Marmoricola endophyticus]|uniref:Acetyltransferase n=1 Tax=Marmoricola endophyticus TaxID=2040280 RepID=A0A917BF67_9ACTN|nr:GNAT family N-acetyltransferase [Marmoricola endophyticus]GGF37827.1 acetyltransferase [Marmoricola endophyticus]
MTRSEDVVLQPAVAGDADEVAALHLAAREAAYPLMPPAVHPREDVRRHVARTVRSGTQETWVARGDVGLLGYVTLTPTWLDALYVAPAHQRCGVGSALIELVKALRPAGFGLWVFVSNAPARAFYRRHGLVEVETTDGHDNEERAPDVRMTWTSDAPAGPVRLS